MLGRSQHSRGSVQREYPCEEWYTISSKIESLGGIVGCRVWWSLSSLHVVLQVQMGLGSLFMASTWAWTRGAKPSP